MSAMAVEQQEANAQPILKEQRAVITGIAVPGKELTDVGNVTIFPARIKCLLGQQTDRSKAFVGVSKKMEQENSLSTLRRIREKGYHTERKATATKTRKKSSEYYVKAFCECRMVGTTPARYFQSTYH
jgi:hypothetical protein